MNDNGGPPSKTIYAILAWIFTSHNGQEMTRWSLFQEHVSSAHMAEPLAIRSALQHAIDLNLNFIWLRSDSQVLIGAISAERPPTELYGVLSDIGHRLALPITVFCVLSFFFHQKSA